jgi:predicted ArsR family transcriptional regulator
MPKPSVPPPLPPSSPKSTRLALLDILKREGPQDAKTLAARLGITSMAIGLQLSSLEEEKLVEARPEPPTPGRRGRPGHRWALTVAADRVFPDAHALLTVGLLESLQEVYGEGGMRKLLDARTRHQREEYGRAVPAEAPLKEKVKALARLRDREGYMTEVQPAPGGGWRLIENHCPICTAARACRGFCQSEWQVFSGLMGAEAVVTREEHLLTGGRRCVYDIKPAGIKPAKTENPAPAANRKGEGK